MPDKALNEGRSLFDLVLAGAPNGYFFGFRSHGRDRWGLCFGNAKPLAGEWGVWSAIFEPDGEIARIRLWRHLISQVAAMASRHTGGNAASVPEGPRK